MPDTNRLSAIGGVYQIRHLPTDRSYIGSTKNFAKRWNEHRLALSKGCHPNRHLQFAWAKYPHSDFAFEILEVIDTPAQLVLREQEYLDQRFTAKGSHEFNLAPKADSTLGVKMPEEAKRKISALHRGRKQSPEIVERRANTMRQNGPSERFLHWAASRKGIATGPKSPETIAKISAAKRGEHWSDAMRIAWEKRAHLPLTEKQIAMLESGQTYQRERGLQRDSIIFAALTDHAWTITIPLNIRPAAQLIAQELGLNWYVVYRVLRKLRDKQGLQFVPPSIAIKEPAPPKERKSRRGIPWSTARRNAVRPYPLTEAQKVALAKGRELPPNTTGLKRYNKEKSRRAKERHAALVATHLTDAPIQHTLYEDA